ncbi:GtrA family protein [Leifsonia aquatica]|uniref:GtrA-like protein n=2 Tax=Leifsonia aquatica TaxID=144185 RepID=U2TF43_LEIAQ|nr:GtrA family protein [Leifsonia aquatica]ERK73317.1 GtrA-like protein [Leifsonia aquatica ATCC 14665]MBB2965455.1 putative flippase GtrA [Leifsonia aquatica]
MADTTPPPDAPASASSPLARLLGHSAVRYLIAGGLSFLVDFGLLALLHDVLLWPVWLASGTSFLLSFAFTYTIQRIFSFGSTAPHGRAVLRYTLLVAFNTIATVIIVSLINSSVAGWAGGKIIATVVTTVWNYFAYRYWVFADPRQPEPGPDAGPTERT